MEKYAPIA